MPGRKKMSVKQKKKQKELRVIEHTQLCANQRIIKIHRYRCDCECAPNNRVCNYNSDSDYYSSDDIPPDVITDIPNILDSIPTVLLDDIPDDGINEIPVVLDEIPAVLEDTPDVIDEIPAVLEDIPDVDVNRMGGGHRAIMIGNNLSNGGTACQKFRHTWHMWMLI